MTLRKRIALFAASVAVIGAGTLAATVKPAAAAPMMPIVAASAGHYNWSLADIFGGNHSDRDDRHDSDRDHHDYRNRDRGYSRDNSDRGRDNGYNHDNGNRDWHNRDNGDRGRDNGYRNDGDSRDGGDHYRGDRGGDGHDDRGR